jgi:hypothetical protein
MKLQTWTAKHQRLSRYKGLFYAVNNLFVSIHQQDESCRGWLSKDTNIQLAVIYVGRS